MFDKPCKQCKGRGVFLKDEQETVCEACSGTGSGLMHMQNMFSQQLANTITKNSDALHEIRKKSFDLLNKYKKPNE